MSVLASNYSEDRAANEKQLEEWLTTHGRSITDIGTTHPVREGSPDAPTPPRSRTWDADDAARTVSIQPQNWRVYLRNITSKPSPLWEALPGMATISVQNVDATNSIIVAATEIDLLNGFGKTIKSGDPAFELGTSAGGWAMTTTAGTVAQVEVILTWYESPISHLPPKQKKD